MRRIFALLGLTALATAFIGCGAYQYTAGVCDCAPPPVHTVLHPPQLPPHLCNHTQPGPAPLESGRLAPPTPANPQ